MKTDLKDLTGDPVLVLENRVKVPVDGEAKAKAGDSTDNSNNNENHCSKRKRWDRENNCSHKFGLSGSKKRFAGFLFRL
jgi:hypothetical protein